MSVVLFSIGIFFLGIALNGLFAGYETGFISADKIRLRYLAEEEDNAKAKQLLRHIEAPDTMLTIVLVGTNVSLIFGTLAITNQIVASTKGFAFISESVSHVWLPMLVATPMFLIFAEIVPKSIFRSHPTRLSLRLLPVIRFFEYLLLPLTAPTIILVKIARALLGVSGDQESTLMSSEDDLRNLVDESAARGSIEKSEQEMIHGVISLQTKQAKEIMVPRTEVQALPKSANREELIELFKHTGLTRILIYDESIDTILGVANVYDVMLDHESVDTSIARFAREVSYVPDTKPIDDLLQELKQRSEHLAVVTDEYGGMLGIITLEDVLEEIFGEIHDEHDKAFELIQQVGPRNYVIDGRMPLEEASEVINMPIDEDEVETIGGWVMLKAGRIPAQGEKILFDGFRVIILEGNTRRVIKIRLDLLDVPLTE
ncbi:MAG: hemolysin family protein [Candidatus Hydrogenedentota bacterium]